MLVHLHDESLEFNWRYFFGLPATAQVRVRYDKVVVPLHVYFRHDLIVFEDFFSSFRLIFAWVTMVAVIYAVVSLTVGEGLDVEAKDDKALFARIAVMYVVVASVNLVSSSERMKRREAVERERALQGERIELSQTIHDTVAQSVYVVGLGVETARDLARKTSDELASRLDETHTLSRTALWELRHPIDSGRIFEGMGLGEALISHAYSFTALTSLPVEVV